MGKHLDNLWPVREREREEGGELKKLMMPTLNLQFSSYCLLHYRSCYCQYR